MGDRYEFGRWLQQKRNDVGITQIAASRQFGFISKASVVGYENGLSPIPIKRIFDLARIYQISMTELLEKLRECDPRLAMQFDKLAIMFSEYQVSLMAERHPGAGLHKQNYQDTGHNGHARHHQPFTNAFSYLENIRELTEVYIIRHRNNTPQDTPPEIYLPGLTDFAKIRPQNVLDIGTYAH